MTSQYYLRARFYNPVTARFTQEDTYYGDGLNLYQYCANNPVVYKDPSGHNICPGQLDLYKKYKEQGMSPKEAYDAMRKDFGLSAKNPFTAESQGGTKSMFLYSDKTLINAANDIHYAQYGDAWWGKKNPVTVTQATDGTVVVFKNNGVIGPKSRQTAIKIFGSNVIIVQGRGVNYNNAVNVVKTASPNHAEARGIQALISRDIAVSGARQATTLPSCSDCKGLQEMLNVNNITDSMRSAK